MELTTEGRFRVLDSPRDQSELLLIDLETLEPTYVRTDRTGDALDDAANGTFADGDDNPFTDGDDSALADLVADIRPGFVVEATLTWSDEGTPRFTSVDIERRTRIEFIDDVTGIFEAAREAWQAAEVDNEGMNSRVTYDTDGAPNGVLYVFAKQSGARDLFEEFKSGVLPLEPLIQRVNEDRDDDAEREVFVMRPVDEPFILVYIVFRSDGLLANTVRDTYDCPRT